MPLRAAATVRIGTRKLLWAGLLLWWPVITVVRSAGYFPHGLIHAVIVGTSGTLGFAMSLRVLHRSHERRRQSRTEQQQEQWREHKPPVIVRGKGRPAYQCACHQEVAEVKALLAAAWTASGLTPPGRERHLRPVAGESTLP